MKKGEGVAGPDKAWPRSLRGVPSGLRRGSCSKFTDRQGWSAKTIGQPTAHDRRLGDVITRPSVGSRSAPAFVPACASRGRRETSNPLSAPRSEDAEGPSVPKARLPRLRPVCLAARTASVSLVVQPRCSAQERRVPSAVDVLRTETGGCKAGNVRRGCSGPDLRHRDRELN